MITLSALYAVTVALAWAVLTYIAFEWIAGNIVIFDPPLAHTSDDLDSKVSD
jgi:hypothetical protein